MVKVEESAAKKSAISRIFQVKNSKQQVKAEVKSEAVLSPTLSTASEPVSILKRLDGRPILMCKIPISSIRSMGSKKRERKTSASEAVNSKKVKREKSSPASIDMKPDATDLVDLPGYNPGKSARNLMPPPENKVDEDNFAAAAQNPIYDEPINGNAGGNQAKDEFQVIFT